MREWKEWRRKRGAIAAMAALLFCAVRARGLEPPPDEAAQAKALTMIRGLFKEEYAKTGAADKAMLARRFIQEAIATTDDKAARYVLLAQAAELASTAGDAPTAVRAIETQAMYTMIETLPAKEAAVLRARNAAGTPENKQSAALACATVMEEAVGVDDFAAARPLATAAESAAADTRKVDLVSAIAQRVAEYKDTAAEFAAAQKARETLKNAPDDAAANLVVGHYECLTQGRWKTGLVFLEKGSDATLKLLAQMEMADPPDGLHQVALADGWWDVGQKLAGRTHRQVMDHATAWYRTASVALTGITLTRINSRIQGATTKPGAATQGGAEGATDLLALVDTTVDAVSGQWRVINGKLVCEASRNARVEVPYRPPEEYDLRVTFARRMGEGAVVLLVVGEGEPFGWAMDVQGHEARFEAVNHKIKQDNPTAAPLKLENGRVYNCVLRVRKDGVTALLDGKVISSWKTDYIDMSRYALWKLNDQKALGLGVGNSEVVFEKVEVVEVTGKGKKTR